MTRRIIATTLSFIMLFTLLPWQYMKAYAEPGLYDPTNYKVTSVNIGKTYDHNGELTNMYIDIEGVNIRGASAWIDTYEFGRQSLNQYRTENEADFLKFEIRGDQIQDEAAFLGQRLIIGGYTVNINEQEIPKINEVTRRVEEGQWTQDGQLVIQGSQLDNIVVSPQIKAQYGRPGNYHDFPAIGTYTPSQIILHNLTGELGPQSIVLIKSHNTTHSFPGQGQQTVAVDIRHTYTNQFSLYRRLQLDGIEMRPNRGETGDLVYFRRETLNNYDVFFLEAIDGTDRFSNHNRGVNPIYTPNAEGTTDILTVRVPELPVGEYYVVITNPIMGGDPQEGVHQEFILQERFTIIDANIKSRINSVQPPTGPDTGSQTEIVGQFFGSLNIPEFKPDNTNATINPPAVENPNEMVVNYGTGLYKDHIHINSATRRITVLIGGQATFVTQGLQGGGRDYIYSFDSNIDRITLRTPQVADADINPHKDVVVVTETIFTRSDGGEPIIIRERAELEKGFTYIPSKVRPNIEEVLPEKLQVAGTPGNYRVPGQRMVAIHGQNFMIHRYIKEDGTEVVRYPIVHLGNNIIINKNDHGEGREDVYLKVLNANGEELDGTSENEIGTKILLIVPENQHVANLGRTFVRVINPVRNSDTLGFDHQLANAIEFVNPGDHNNPIINNIRPDTVSVEGGEEIIIEGRNFQNDVRVFIDGQEVLPINREEDSTRISFIAPPGREGATQLQVMNPQGGMDTGTFTYVRTFTNPRITDFSPKRGNTGTLVMIKGENFLRPDPTATPNNIQRLIGTRVLLGGIEINQYNRNPITQNIELRDYISPINNKLFRIENNSLVVAEEHQSVFLQEVQGPSPGRLYTVVVNPNGSVTLSDGARNNYTIQLNGARTQVVASRQGGEVHPVNVTQTGITIEKPQANHPFEPISLKLTTLYRVENGEILGHRGRVADRNQILFTVPILEANGFYDLTVINPDTKRDSRTGQQGFEYYILPESNPQIDRVEPREGSVDGGYKIQIIGRDFVDDGTNKPEVYINGVQVNPGDVSVDINGEIITALVPPYQGDLREDKETSRLAVPIVIVNHDGGSASKEDGFIYVIPSSRPEITGVLMPSRGTAAGGDVVDIVGNQFRYFEPYEDINRNQMWEEGDPFHDLNNNGQWDDLLDIQRMPGESDAAYQERRDLLLGKIPLDHREYDYYYDSPILPRVYFGENQAKIVEFTRGRLRVITPASTPGAVEVYVLNNDAGLSNKVNFTYEGSNPQITEVVPNKGTRLGGDRLEVWGTGFARSSIDVYQEEMDPTGNTSYRRENIPLVRFADITNGNIPLDQDNSGRIINRRTIVNLPGNLRVEYDGHENRVRIRIEEGGITYRGEILGYDNSVKYIPVSLLKDGEGTGYTQRNGINYGDELLRIAVEGQTRFVVERGYAPEVEYLSPRHIRVKTPSYHTIGMVSLNVINADGGKVSRNFEYTNPDSKPRIIEITKEREEPILETIVVDGREIEARVLRMTYEGGNTIRVYGEDFRQGGQIRISNITTIASNQIIRERVENPFAATPHEIDQLTFEMPDVGKGAIDIPHRVIVSNPDSGHAYSDGIQPPIYIIFEQGESAPTITAVSPAEGPVSGGTKVEIIGDDFREEMLGFETGSLKVYFGDTLVDPGDIRIIDDGDNRKIQVDAPLSETFGTVDIKVENPDRKLAILRNGFTYISRPRISNVNPSKIFANATETDVTITGSMFMPGARVIIGGEVMDKGNTTQDMQIMGEGINRVDSHGVNIVTAVVGGREAASVTVVDGHSLVVRFHEDVNLANSNIIIINPDGGISGAYDRFGYDIPVPNRPLVLEAIPGYESTVQLIWSESAPEVLNAAEGYEVYGRRKEERNYSFVGSTQNASFLVRNLEPNTIYSFMVRALNQYGGAEEFAEVTVTTFSRREDDKLRDQLQQLEEEERRLRQEGKEEIVGSSVIRTLGKEQIPEATYFDSNPYIIDFSAANYQAYSKFTVAIPIDIISNNNARSITITDGRASFTFRPRNLYTREVSQIAPGDVDDAYVRISLEKIIGREEEALRTAIPRTQARASRTYGIDFQLQAGTNNTSIRQMMQQGQLRISADSITYQGVNTNQLFIGKYDASQDKFIKLQDGSDAAIQEAGKYTLLSNR